MPTATPGVATLAWSPPSTIAGYYVYYGTQPGGPYTTKIDVGLNYQYTLSGLTSGQTYYAVTDSYDTNRVESCPTAEVSFVVP